MKITGINVHAVDVLQPDIYRALEFGHLWHRKTWLTLTRRFGHPLPQGEGEQ